MIVIEDEDSVTLPNSHLPLVYCPEYALVIEVDGEIHTSEDAREYDQERDNLLKSCGLQVLRFSNHQVLHDTPTTLTQIQHVLSLPSPPGKGEAGRGSSSNADKKREAM